MPDAQLKFSRCPDQLCDLPSTRRTPLGQEGEDRLAVHHHVQHTRRGEAHLGREVKMILDFPLEAPGLQQNAESGKTPLDLDGQGPSVSASRDGRQLPPPILRPHGHGFALALGTPALFVPRPLSTPPAMPVTRLNATSPGSGTSTSNT